MSRKHLGMKRPIKQEVINNVVVQLNNVKNMQIKILNGELDE